jgi:DNA polymerase, archaea type
MRYLDYDIEVLPKEDGSFPTSDKCPIIIISIAFEPPYKDLDTLVLSTKTNCQDEDELLLKFLDIIDQYDPDIIVGYNINEFDNQYVTDRLDIHDIKNNIGRNKQGWYGKFSQERNTWYCPGRIILDLLPLVKKHLNQTEYKGLKAPLKEHNLRYVAKNFLKIEKMDIKPSEMRGIWESPNYLKMVEYAERDAVVTRNLRQEMQILDKYIALSEASGALVQDILNGGQSTMIDNLMIREFKEYDRVVPMRPTYEGSEGDVDFVQELLECGIQPIEQEEKEEKGKKKIRYAGAIVLELEPGLYESIIVMDFSSLYPSIMRAFNLSPDTIFYDGDRPMFRTDFKGIVPGILERLYNQRVAFKKAMKTAPDKHTKEIYNLKQYGCKILLNSIYGYFGFAHSRLFEVSIAAKVTEEGRKALLLTKETVEAYPGCRVIAGDTDSVFICNSNIKTFEEAKVFAGEITAKMKEKLPAPMSLAFEAFGSRALLLAKKRYAMYITEDGKEYKIKARGIEIRRRDWCQFTEETLSNTLDIILKEGDIAKAGSYAKSQIDRIANLQNVNDDPDLMTKLVLSKKYSKPLDQYKTKAMHMEAVKRALVRGDDSYKMGDRVPFYVTASPKKSVSDTTEVCEFVLENNIPINKKYYIEKQLLPPLSRIFAALDYNIYSKITTKQKSLFYF